VIPKGWRIYVYTREINYDPYLYPDPLSFNPWRWLVSDYEIIIIILFIFPSGPVSETKIKNQQFP
jgi:brassinosteroid-6-oxidase 2